MKTLKKLSKKQWCIGILTLWALLCLLVTPVYTTIMVNYEPDPSGEAITTVFTSFRENVTAKGARARVIYNGVARVSFCDLQYGKHCSVKRIDPLDENWNNQESITISSITIKKNGLTVWSESGKVLNEYFLGNDQIVMIDSENGLSFEVLGNDSQLLPTEKFVQEYISAGRIMSIVTSFCYGVAFMLMAYMLGIWFAKELGEAETRFGKVTYWIFLGGIIGAILLCFYIGGRSPFWLNPDEYEVRSAVRYYQTNWMPPDLRSDTIADAFAVYGTSRHSEFNIFYFLTGKIGQFFEDPALQSRWLNMGLFLVMAAIVIKYCKKYFALLFVLLLTPQLWFIYSYTTSDALDFFWGFLCIFQLMKEDSMLNHILEKTFSPKQIPGYLLLAFLFVNMFWAKVSFYPILLFVFLILLIRLFEKQGEERKRFLRKCLVLVGLTCAIFIIRYMITDFKYYGFDKYGVYNEVMELRATYEYKPSTPPHEQAGSIYLYNKGVPLSVFFGEMRFNQDLFHTFAGFFGNYNFGMESWYYYVMGALYITLFGCLIFELVKMKNKQKWMEFVVVVVCIGIQYLLIFINGYFVDFQPQGRYMLPALLFVTYLVYACKESKNNKMLRFILCATCILSLYAYLTIGAVNMVPLNTSAIS